MTTDSDDTRRPARSSADVERALRSAYEATDRLPIEDDPSTARLSDLPERAGNRWRASSNGWRASRRSCRNRLAPTIQRLRRSRRRGSPTVRRDRHPPGLSSRIRDPSRRRGRFR